MQSYLDSPQYRMLMAQVLQGQSGSRSPGEAVAKGFGTLADAWALKRYQDKGEARDKAYSDSIASALAPKLDPTYQQSMIDNQMPGNVADQAPYQTPKNGNEIMAALLGSGNSDVVNDFGPGLLEAQLRNQPKPAEPFTLNEGGVRYGPDGKPIATNPKAAPVAQPFTLGPGQRRYGPNGEVIADVPEKVNPNQPFNPDGTPNTGYQDYEKALRAIGPPGQGLLTVAPGSTVLDRGTGQPVFTAPTSPTRQMQPKAINDLSDAGAQASAMDRLSGGFKPEYGGHTLLGGLSNTIGRLTGDPTGQTQWWQDYQTQLNLMRNKLFGAALTAQEKGEFEKAVINPRMAPEEIQKNLKRQDELAYQAARKLAKAYVSAGYPKDAVEGALGINLDQLEGVPAPTGQDYAQPTGGLPQGVTEEDIQHTLKLHPEMTRAQLLQKLGGR